MPGIKSQTSFKRGFLRGFSVTNRFFSTKNYSYRPSATDARAWIDTGILLNKAYREEGAKVVKTTREKARTQSKQPA